MIPTISDLPQMLGLYCELTIEHRRARDVYSEAVGLIPRTLPQGARELHALVKDAERFLAIVQAIAAQQEVVPARPPTAPRNPP
jgi:hypothetical protein